jgi:hypothetical protein
MVVHSVVHVIILKAQAVLWKETFGTLLLLKLSRTYYVDLTRLSKCALFSEKKISLTCCNLEPNNENERYFT